MKRHELPRYRELYAPGARPFSPKTKDPEKSEARKGLYSFRRRKKEYRRITR